ILNIIKSNQSKDIKLVHANTSSGYYKSEKNISSKKILIDIENLEELKNINTSKKGITIGAGCTITNVIKTLENAISCQNSDKTKSFGHLINHMYRIASYHVRNVGCIAGNIAM